MSNSLTVSVVIPCFNDGPYLTEALQSVFAQTLQPIEVLVIDDGSTNSETVTILRNLDEPRIKVIHQVNRGLSAARNTGIHHAEGEYIYFLDADDVIYPQCLLTLSRMLETSDAVAATSAIRICGGSVRRTVWGRPFNPYLILVENQWSAGIMLRAQLSKQFLLLYDESMRSGYEDWEFNIRLVQTGRQILFFSEPLYEYRVRRKSLLSRTRKVHVEVVNYIRVKHRDLYGFENLLHTKRAYAPTLQVFCNHENSADLHGWLATQTFRDWSINSAQQDDTKGRYCFVFSSIEGLKRLPPEALECALIALECYSRARQCVMAVRQDSLSLFATPTLITGIEDRRYPIALITRNDDEQAKVNLKQLLRECDLLLEFPDQNPISSEAWSPSLIQIRPNALMTDNLGSMRKNLRTLGKRVFGDSFQRECIRFYDYLYYQVLRSDSAFAARNKIGSILGTGIEKTLSALVFGLFLTEPPDRETTTLADTKHPRSEKLSPLFTSAPDKKIHVLIATNWLIEGGVEQVIFELCRLLEPSRFRITIVTTRASHHAWDGIARKVGASVYHLADFLKPTDMVKGFLHLIFNHHIDCMFIMNSEIAYRMAKTLKRVAPWLPIMDRIEAPDPGGGYPMISAKVGREFIDLRTVSHKKLAKDMYKNYRLLPNSLRVIYIGMNTNRIEKFSNLNSGLLHQACSVSQETPVVLFIGRFENQKRPDIFVRAAAKIFEIHTDCNAHFAMVGDGHLLDSVKTLISEYKLAHRIHTLGAHQNAVELLADATLLMMPSAYEGLALVSYEAMALGIPQIFANVNGQSELITPETGILIDNGPGEETRYAKACLELLSDAGRRIQMATAGKERIKSHFTAQNAVKQYAQIFEEMAELGRKRASEILHLKPPHINPLREFV